MYRIDCLVMGYGYTDGRSNAENQSKRLEPYLGNMEGNLITLLIELKAQFYKVLTHLMK